jgi:hypothetical protein
VCAKRPEGDGGLVSGGMQAVSVVNRSPER